MFHMIILPIGSMYGIYANIWGILMINVTIYSIHGSYGLFYRYFSEGVETTNAFRVLKTWDMNIQDSFASKMVKNEDFT